MKLTSNEILANNKLIAKFMGRQVVTDGIGWFDEKFKPINGYEKSWDKLMPVIEKIEKEYKYIFSSLYDPTLKEYDIFIDHQNKTFTNKNKFDNLDFEEHFDSKLKSYYWAVLKIIKQINE